MILNVVIDGQRHQVQAPDHLVQAAGGFFDKMDADMDQGWQMSRTWVPHPTRINRCQIVANKLLTAMETEDPNLQQMMAAYLLNRAPDIDYIDIDIEGNMLDTQVVMKPGNGEVVDMPR
ncbi:MAG: hypothetical protein H6981_09610 [Gammaproteobacteria bacterium]|nr:hypothetical protein [Gammaproteobacteria bacterium]MCP5137043.1 hypothetical protein [Gammaproteobacteria bacterium]